MGIMETLFGKNSKMMTPSTMTGGQGDLLQQLMSGLSGGPSGGGALGGGMDWLQKLMGGDTSQFEAPLMRKFHEQTIPDIAHQFAGIGGLSSGSFNQAMGQAGAGLSENLGKMRGDMQMQGMGQLQNMMGQGLGAKSFENVYRPQSFGFVGELLKAISAMMSK